MDSKGQKGYPFYNTFSPFALYIKLMENSKKKLGKLCQSTTVQRGNLKFLKNSVFENQNLVKPELPKSTTDYKRHEI
jgi:hypothetical protein